MAYIFADFSIYWWFYDPVFCVFLKKTNKKTLGASVTLAAVVIPTKRGVGVKGREFWCWLWCGSLVTGAQLDMVIVAWPNFDIACLLQF